MTVQFAFLLVLAWILVLPGALRQPAAHRRLRRTGRWFPAVLWLITLALMIASFAVDFRVHPVAGGVAFATLLLAPFCAALITLAWRDARTGERLSGVTDASATRPFGTRAPRWVRGTCALFSPLSAVVLATAVSEAGWEQATIMLLFAALTGFVAVTGRVPAWLAGRT